MARNKFNITKVISTTKSAIRSLPSDVSIILENFINANFRSESFGGKKWPKRKRAERGTRRALLVKSGQLKRETTNVQIQGNKIFVETDLPYAETHNEGLDSRNIPQRQFVGNSPKLDNKIKKQIIKKLNKAFK